MGETLNPNPVVQHSGTGVCLMPSQEAGRYQFTLAEFDSYYGYGLAGIDNWLNQVSAVDGSVYTFIQHGDIAAMSSSSSGMLGGAVLTLYGSGFSYNLSNNVVLVADLPCPVVSASATELQCVIPPWNPSASSEAGKSYPGGRGLFWEVRDGDSWSLVAVVDVVGCVDRSFGALVATAPRFSPQARCPPPQLQELSHQVLLVFQDAPPVAMTCTQNV
jgi:IPT/TIG domain